ncbi:MAG: SDR family oxidoreductase, partial [Candidatus Hydrogenedentota bacterium]
IIPAEVLTPQYESWLDGLENAEETLDKITSLIPLGNRMTKSSEVADMATFLASERSSHTTGQHIYVDGGYTHLDKANIERRED